MWIVGSVDRENVVCLGASGTGKTHVARAIGLAAIYAGARVRFTTAITLAQELLAAADEHRLPRYLRSWRNADLVIVDELGYLPLGPGAPLMFQFFAERYEAGSVLVTTNLERIGRRTQDRFSTRTISIKDRPEVLGQERSRRSPRSRVRQVAERADVARGVVRLDFVVVGHTTAQPGVEVRPA